MGERTLGVPAVPAHAGLGQLGAALLMLGFRSSGTGHARLHGRCRDKLWASARGVEYLSRLWSLPTGPGRADSDRRGTGPHPVTSECVLCGRGQWASAGALVGNETNHAPFLVQRTVPPCLNPEASRGGRKGYSVTKDLLALCRPHRDGVALRLGQSSARGESHT